MDTTHEQSCDGYMWTLVTLFSTILDNVHVYIQQQLRYIEQDVRERTRSFFRAWMWSNNSVRMHKSNFNTEKIV